MSVPVVVGLGFGDEGKGSVVDALVRRTGASCVVRFGGGPQAAHHVVADDGRAHVFAQVGAGALVRGVATVLARGMVVDPLGLQRELQALRRLGVEAEVAVDPCCRVVTPWQRGVGRMRELARGGARHGSCGRGVGEAIRDAAWMQGDALLAGDLLEPRRGLARLEVIRHAKLDVAEQLVDEHPGLRELARTLRELGAADFLDAAHAALRSGPRLQADEEAVAAHGERLVLEGAHGVLLDRHHGFWPHVTQTDTTFGPAERLLARVGLKARRIGVLRAYQTRHGAGPLPSEDAGLTARLPEAHNTPNDWQGAMRCGWLDLVALRHALSACGGVDTLALTCVDRLSGAPVAVATGHRLDGAVLTQLPAIDPDDLEARAALTAKLARCEPLLTELPGWGQIDGRLPAELLDFVSFLESSSGLAAPVDLLSLGPTASGKRFLEPADAAC